MDDSNDSILAELKAKHGTVFAFEDADEGLIAFRRPTRLEWRAFKQNRNDDDKRAIADEILCKSVIVHPSTAAFEQILDRKPGLALMIQGEVIQAAGGVNLEVKKL